MKFFSVFSSSFCWNFTHCAMLFTGICTKHCFWKTVLLGELWHVKGAFVGTAMILKYKPLCSCSRSFSRQIKISGQFLSRIGSDLSRTWYSFTCPQIKICILFAVLAFFADAFNTQCDGFKYEMYAKVINVRIESWKYSNNNWTHSSKLNISTVDIPSCYPSNKKYVYVQDSRGL